MKFGKLLLKFILKTKAKNSQCQFEVRCFHIRWQALRSCPCAWVVRCVWARWGRRRWTGGHEQGACGWGWVGVSPWSPPLSHTQKPAPHRLNSSVCWAELQSLLGRNMGDLRAERISGSEMQNPKEKVLINPNTWNFNFYLKGIFRSCKLEDTCYVYKMCKK